jgi:hypothetical protein
MAEEDLLLSTLEHPNGVSRLAIAYRLTHQRGPRDREPARMGSFLALARRLGPLRAAETKWLGRALGAVSLETREARDALSAFVRDAGPDLASSTVVGIGVAHPGETAALDVVDSLRRDPRPGVRLATLDAYAEDGHRDPARSCTAWAALLDDPPNELRAAGLLSGSPECAVHHPAVLELAEKRLADDPNSGMSLVLPGLCSTKATAARAAVLATKVLTKVMRGTWGDPLRAIGLCDARGPERGLAPYLHRKDDIGLAARRVADDILHKRGQR